MFLDCSAVIAPNTRAPYGGVAAADLDGDGEVEFFVCGLAGPNRVLKWTGSTLRDVAPPELAGPSAVGAAFADLDGDGRDELYLQTHRAAADRLFDPTPDGGWVDLFSPPDDDPMASRELARGVAALDRRGTGRYAFLVASPGRPLRLYELSPAGPVTDLAPVLGIDQARAGGLIVAPFAGDRSDVLCLRDEGSNFLFRNTGPGTFLEVAAGHGLADPTECGGVGVAVDADGDGRLDVCYTNLTGPQRLMVRRPDGTFQDRATPALALPADVRAVVAADFDNDGFEELFFHTRGEPNRLFRFRPDVGWALDDPGAAAEPDGGGTGAAVADLDGDGRLELLLAHAGGPRPLALYKGPRTGNAWLRVRPLTRFGAPARGAVVRLTAAGRTQVRVIDGGGWCQMEPVAHFGLGRDPVVDAVTVTWPDGATTTLDGPHPLQTVTVPYPGG